MDCRAMAQSLGLEKDEFLEVLTLFFEVSSSDLQNLESGLEKEDPKLVSDAAHSIKGAAMNLGLTDISDIAKGVEMNARESNLNGALEASQVIRQKLEEIQNDFNGSQNEQNRSTSGWKNSMSRRTSHPATNGDTLFPSESFPPWQAGLPGSSLH